MGVPPGVFSWGGLSVLGTSGGRGFGASWGLARPQEGFLGPCRSFLFWGALHQKRCWGSLKGSLQDLDPGRPNHWPLQGPKSRPPKTGFGGLARPPKPKKRPPETIPLGPVLIQGSLGLLLLWVLALGLVLGWFGSHLGPPVCCFLSPGEGPTICSLGPAGPPKGLFGGLARPPKPVFGGLVGLVMGVRKGRSLQKAPRHSEQQSSSSCA